MIELVWLAFAYVAGLAAQKLKLPVLAGYLAAGLVLSSLHVQSTELLRQVGHFGVLFLLFGVGLHIRLDKILNKEIILGAVFHLAISCGVFMGVAYLVGTPLFLAVFMAVVLSFSSTVMAAKDLELRNELGAFHGRVSIGILIVQDIVAIALLAYLGGATPSPWALLLFLLPFLRPILFALLRFTDDDTLLLLFVVCLGIGTAELFHMLGISAELGALVAGALLAGHSKYDDLSDKIWGLKEICLVGFFLNVGLVGFPDIGGTLIALGLLAILPLKAILFFAILVFFGLRARTAFITGATLTSYSEFVLVAAGIAHNRSLISDDIFSILALVTALSFALNLPLNKLVHAIYRYGEAFLLRFERDVRHPDKLIHTFGSSKFLVLGMGRTGTAAYDYITSRGFRCVGLDEDPIIIQRNLENGRRVAYGDIRDGEIWRNVSLSELNGVVLAVPNLEARIEAVRSLRANGFEGQIAAYVLHSREEKLLRKVGATHVSHMLVEAGERLAEMSLSSPIQTDA